MQTAVIYNHETVYLDGETFEGCEFRTCRMIYAGGDVPSFRDCQFADCDWRFDDAAGRTLSFMQQVWSAGGKAQIQALIKTITGGGGR
jgi:hypothetical protein